VPTRAQSSARNCDQWGDGSRHWRLRLRDHSQARRALKAAHARAGGVGSSALETALLGEVTETHRAPGGDEAKLRGVAPSAKFQPHGRDAQRSTFAKRRKGTLGEGER
jgi:hypothetical protein